MPSEAVIPSATVAPARDRAAAAPQAPCTVGRSRRTLDDGARQAVPHHRVQAVARLSHGVRAVCRRADRIFRLDHPPPHHPADHRDHQRRDQRPLGAYGQGGIRRLVLIVDARRAGPGSNLYLVTTPAGEGLAGNVDSLQPGVLEQPGRTETTYRRLDDTEDGASSARWSASCG